QLQLAASADAFLLDLHSIRDNVTFREGPNAGCFSIVRDFRVVVKNPEERSFNLNGALGRELKVAVRCP
ncbi:MAG: hypothetical protein AB7P04_13920, partial [Bacteriovoracia bacterium]